LAEVRLQEGESLENALRRFKRKVMTEDIIKDVKRHSYYLKPGERRRVKQALAQKRARKKIRKESDQVAPRRFAAAKQRPAVLVGNLTIQRCTATETCEVLKQQQEEPNVKA
jgi:small subunit ribosomal protein S21